MGTGTGFRYTQMAINKERFMRRILRTAAMTFAALPATLAMSVRQGTRAAEAGGGRG